MSTGPQGPAARILFPAGPQGPAARILPAAPPLPRYVTCASAREVPATDVARDLTGSA